MPEHWRRSGWLSCLRDGNHVASAAGPLSHASPSRGLATSAHDRTTSSLSFVPSHYEYVDVYVLWPSSTCRVQLNMEAKSSALHHLSRVLPSTPSFHSSRIPYHHHHPSPRLYGSTRKNPARRMVSTPAFPVLFWDCSDLTSNTSRSALRPLHDLLQTVETDFQESCEACN